MVCVVATRCSSVYYISSLHVAFTIFEVLSDAGINWSDLQVLGQSGINWSDLEVLTDAGINWSDLEVLTDAGINWTYVHIFEEHRSELPSLSILIDARLHETNNHVVSI